MSTGLVDESAYVTVSREEILRLREAEQLVMQRIELATSDYAPALKALRASQIRMDELAYGKRHS